MRRAALLGAALLFAACTDRIGPIKEPSFPSLAAAAVGASGERIVMHARVEWYEGLDGALFGAGSMPVEGVVVLFEERLVVLQWNSDSEAYDSLLELRYADAADVRRRVFGATQWFVMAMRNGDLHALIPRTSSGFASAGATGRALNFLRTKIPSSDAPAASGD